MGKAEIIRELEATRSGARQCVVKIDDKYFVVSSVVAYDTGKFETLAFPSDAEGNIQSFTSHAGGIGKSRKKVIAQLEVGDFRDNSDELFEELGGTLGVVAGIVESVGLVGSILTTNDENPQ